MNTTWLNMTNGIAVAAKAKNPPDMNMISICEEMVQRMEYAAGNTYDAATTNSTLIIGFPNYPLGSIAPSYDAEANVGVTNPRLIGG